MAEPPLSEDWCIVRTPTEVYHGPVDGRNNQKEYGMS